MSRKHRSNISSRIKSRHKKTFRVEESLTGTTTIRELNELMKSGQLQTLTLQDPEFVWSNPWDKDTPVGSIPLTCNLCGEDIPPTDLEVFGILMLKVGMGLDSVRGPVGHNPYPLIETGKERCCDTCNSELVLPSRDLRWRELKSL